MMQAKGILSVRNNSNLFVACVSSLSLPVSPLHVLLLFLLYFKWNKTEYKDIGQRQMRWTKKRQQHTTQRKTK